MRRLMYVMAIVTVCAVAGVAGSRLYAQAKPPATALLTGSPLGAVKFEHAKHTATYGAKCIDCHHASKAEKPGKAEQKCSECHTKVAAAPMKTKYMNAFHDAMAKAGTCQDCHIKQAAAGKKTPKVCADCHKKSNG